MMRRVLVASALLFSTSIGTAVAQSAPVILKNAEGVEVGRVDLTQGATGVIMRVTMKNLPVGEHAFHVHENGKCEPPFTSAGGHFNPEGRKHGAMAAGGHHAGDMPNLIVPASGEMKAELVNEAVTLEKDKPNSLFKQGGTALVIHADADDYRSDPTGNAGGRIACGVVQ